VAEAQELVLAAVRPVGVETVDLLAALGRVLAEDVRAPRPIPPADNSAMDGYAVRFVDVAEAGPDHPVTLPVAEIVPAGGRARAPLPPGQAIKVMTGAPLPAGADTVVRVEHTDGGDRIVTVRRAPAAGENVRRAGEDLAAGDLVLAAGTWLRPAELGLLASVNRPRVLVTVRPRVAILATGDEIADVGDPEAALADRIVNANSYSLAGQVLEAGGIPQLLGVAPDRREAIRERIEAGLAADVLVTSGGVSVGDFDYVKEVLDSLGFERRFWNVRIRPGGPIAFGLLAGRPVFCLPGNPVASMVTAELFLRPALRAMLRHPQVARETVQARLAEPIRVRRGYRSFLRGVLRREGGDWLVATTGPQGSGILRSMSLADGLIVVPEDVETLSPGDRVEVMRLDR
ncbi:MAG TPA: gephyrin-like molybdotransferase Glp, partial [Thermodesulfobacteriota bacterium]|nr:gephyrin-like molybdotransferase Glp [Thermodesulfobacteriota bacterium]